jgi:hypothetical protein
MVVSREAELWAATRVVGMHRHRRGCAHCTQDGCRMLTWAEAIRRQAERDGFKLPEVREDVPGTGVGADAVTAPDSSLGHL